MRKIWLLCVFTFMLSCNKGESEIDGTDKIELKEYALEIDYNSLIRNPCTGWGLYDDAPGFVANGIDYWDTQGSSAEKYASFFYVRWRWSEMEPEEGKYAWIYNKNYKRLIQGALDRGLKLAFRVYNHGQDNAYPSTPDFVRQAGANGFYTSDGRNHWTPYIDDPIFQQKLANFIKAFGEEYDNPQIVDHVDGTNFGWWGECGHLELKNAENREPVLEWITDTYSENFTKTILVLPFNTGFGYASEKRIAIDRKGYAMRRDGLGSMWFGQDEQLMAMNAYKDKILKIGESCYWGGSSPEWQPWKDDVAFDFKSWRDVYQATCHQAIDLHFNTLDLRNPPETKGWTTVGLDLVEKFIREGGYRLCPKTINFPKVINKKLNSTITHTWINLGKGIFPNNNIRWNYKYKVAFSLLNSQNEIVKMFVDESAEPSDWIYGGDNTYTLKLKFDDVHKGNYCLAVAIIDVTNDNKPGINLSLTNKTVNGWTSLGEILVLD